MSRKLMKFALMAYLAFMHAVTPAEDIDLFAGTSSGGANVLILLDNTSNWSAQNQKWPGGITQGQAELNAIKTVIGSLAPSGQDADVNVGLMMLTDVNSNSTAGGYVRSAMKPMTVANRTAFTTLLQTIYDNFSTPSEKGPSSLDYDRAMFEVFKYFGGYTSPANATSDVAGTPINATHFGPLRYAEADSKTDPDAFADPTTKLTYKPASESGDVCPRNNYLIFIGNGFPNQTTADGEALLPGVGGSKAQIYNESPLNKNRFTDEWARFLYQTDVSETVGKQNVITYTINVFNAQPSAEQGRLLTSMAVVGGGSPFEATSAAAIEAALRQIFSEIQSVNSAFASASLPVSVNAQGTFLNQIFIGMFRPEEEPRWFGNLKQYQFVADVDAAGNVVGLKTGDKNDNPVVSPLTGFITPCAESFWSSDDTYWPSGYQGNCLVSDERSNLPDGEVVEKGGAAQKLRAISPAARIVKTCNSGACTALTNFDATNTNITKALLGNGSMSNDNRADLINWARGRNVDNELSKGTEATVMRPSVHGDVVHSRPLAIDYGGTTGVVVFYGGNDGMFRAINGNKADRVGNSFPAGSELWSFVAPEHFGKLNRLKTNSPIVNFPSVPTSTTPTPTSKDYFFDGPIGVYSSGTTKWIYPTMRRGGRSVYAFDVSTPTGPVLKWKRDENSTGFSNIGQTWSEPKVVKVAGYPTLASATKSPVIIMGGGYDACEDQDAAPNTTCTSPKGNRIYVLDADTGALLQTFNTDRSVVANITVRDSDGDGMTDIAYAVDTGANIYRISIGTRTPSDTTTGWTMTKIAALGCTSAASCDRKFLQAPEVVVTADYNAVLVGSGNRERPLLSNNATQVDNAFFMIKDVPSDSSQGLITTSSTTSTGANSLIAIDASLEPTQAQLTELAKPTNKGWHLAFGSGGHDKEQVVTSAVVIAGVAYFSTHTPTVPMTCGANLGLARGYAVNFRDSSSRDTYKPVAIVEVNADGTVFVSFPDGTTATYPAGTTVVTNSDGTVIVTLPDGTVVEVEPVETNSNRFGVFAGGGLAPSPVSGIVEIAVEKPDGTTRLDKVAFLIGGKPPPGTVGSGIGGSKVEIPVNPVRSRVYWYTQK